MGTLFAVMTVGCMVTRFDEISYVKFRASASRFPLALDDHEQSIAWRHLPGGTRPKTEVGLFGFIARKRPSLGLWVPFASRPEMQRLLPVKS